MLSQASTSGNVGVINLLLKKGADVSVTDKDGVTTLMSAASHGHAQVFFSLRFFRNMVVFLDLAYHMVWLCKNVGSTS